MSKENEIIELKVEPGPNNDMSLVLFGAEAYQRLLDIKEKLGDRFPPRRKDSSLRSE